MSDWLRVTATGEVLDPEYIGVIRMAIYAEANIAEYATFVDAEGAVVLMLAGSQADTAENAMVVYPDEPIKGLVCRRIDAGTVLLQVRRGVVPHRIVE